MYWSKLDLSACNENRHTLDPRPFGLSAPVIWMCTNRQPSEQLSARRLLHNFDTLLSKLDKVGKALHLLQKFDKVDTLLSARCTPFGT